ncbi:MAG: thioredoxin domain-containing protein [Patescibacteria group bacterium]|nr:thioredoxin domain-containing protein [Patescibacteria group bacterium]
MEKKSFFEALEPKSAMIVGIVAGFLTVCTVGFIVLGILALTRGVNCTAEGATADGLATADNAAATDQPATPAPKTDKPKVELFVMSYCPYGLQMEKAYLPVMELLKSRADMSIKFVSYAMHEKKEIDENTRQYCIQKEQPTKFVAYLKCFTGKDDYIACLTTAGVNEAKMNACVAKADKTYGITAKFEDQSTWLSGQYPVYPIDAALNEQYGVQGSPTLIINGVEVSAGRTPEAVKAAVCAAFKTAPKECDTALSTQSMQAGFGTSAGAATDASCG